MTNFDSVLLNKKKLMQIKMGHLSTSTQNSTVIDEIKSSFLLSDIVATTFIPGKISSEKGVEVKVHCRT